MINTTFFDLKQSILVYLYRYLGEIFCLHLQSTGFTYFLLDRL
jgi:hypothetical protein